MKNKEEYQKCKKAYLMTINGCGKDCLECEHEDCICESDDIIDAADKYLLQRQYENKFYKKNRERRNTESKKYYHTVTKLKRPKKDNSLKSALLDVLPNTFTYEEAGKIWLVSCATAKWRLDRFIKRGLVTKKIAKPGINKRRMVAVFTKTAARCQIEFKGELKR
jgi:Fic family protein